MSLATWIKHVSRWTNGAAGRGRRGSRAKVGPLAEARRRRTYRPWLEAFEDRVVPSLFTVMNTTDSKPGSLRQAILDSNANPGANSIVFAIRATTGSGIVTISPQSPLPTITVPVTIDGTSQPRYVASPVVVLDGSQAGAADGLTITGGDTTVRGLDIEGFQGNAIVLTTNGGDIITGNIIGTADPFLSKGDGGDGIRITSSGNAVTGNIIGFSGGDGVHILNGAANVIGGTNPGQGNTIYSNQGNGVDIEGAAATGNIIQGNTIGGAGDANGNLVTNGDFETGDFTGWDHFGDTRYDYVTRDHFAALGAVGDFSSLAQTIPTVPGQYYVISYYAFGGGYPSEFRATWYGEFGGVLDDEVNTNFDRTFTFYEVASSIDTSTDLEFDARNDPSYFWLSDVQVTPWFDPYNAWYGVRITNGASSNQIGGLQTGAANIIGHNGLAGVSIDSGSFSNTVAGNTIRYNGGAGVVVNGLASLGNSVRGNSIHANGGLGIDLGGDGVTPNHPDNPDAGPNQLQNFPIISQVSSSGANLTISGSLNSGPNATFALDFYASASGDLSGFGQGQTYLGAATVTTDASGNASFQVTVPAAPNGENAIAATATDASGDTSEFSPCRTVDQEANTTTMVSSSNNPSMFDQTVTFTATVSPTSGTDTPTGMVTFLDGETALGAAVLSSGFATFTTSVLAIGNHAVSAFYTGGGDFSSSTSAAITQTVNGNHAPVLDPIPDIGVGIGKSLTFTAHATDPDSPPQTLTFSLDPGAPAHAQIDPATGVVTISNLKFGTYTITVRVTDNGSPALSAAQTFHVFVAPQIKAITVNSGWQKNPTVGFLTVIFNTRVNIDAGAFQLTRLGSGGGTVGVSVSQMYVLDGKTYVILTFDGPFVLPGGTLMSGKYALTTQGSLVHDAVTGLALDGDNNGLPGGDNLFRFSAA
jgi:hypothetical protein